MALQNLYVDDLRQEPEGWLRAKTVKEAKDFLVAFPVGTLSLDNDLGFDGIQEEGREIIRWLIEEQEANGADFWPKRIILHSANPVAVYYMKGMIERYAPSFKYTGNGIFDRS